MQIWQSLILCIVIFACGLLVGGTLAYVRTSMRYMRLLRDQHSAYLRVLASDRRILYPVEAPHDC